MQTRCPDSIIISLSQLALQLDGKQLTVVVMKNVLANVRGLKLHELYDLKGSQDHRRTKGGKNTFNAGENVNVKLETRKDMDLERPLSVGPRGKLILNMQIGEDVQWLNSEGLMDYSLLVGIHNCSGLSCPDCKDRRANEVSNY